MIKWLSMFLLLVIPIVCFLDGFRFISGSSSKDTDVSLQVSKRFDQTTPSSTFMAETSASCLIGPLILLLEI